MTLVSKNIFAKKQFFEKTTDMTNQCYVPFREYVPVGHSTFSIPIPNYFADQEFYFSYCTLTPSTFSDQAAKMDLDIPEELEQEFKYKIYYQGEYKDGIPLFPDSITISNSETNILAMVDKINTFFEVKKPIGLNHLGLFIDWYDVRYDLLENTSWDEFVRNLMAFEYYGVPFNEQLHYNKLPVSARSVPGANNYLFPVARVSDVMNNIRFRIHIAHNTNAVFSTDSQFLAMGFIPDQIGKRRKNNKLKMENNAMNEFETITAMVKPSMTIMGGNQLILGLEPHNNFLMTFPLTFTITRKDNFKNINYNIKLAQAMQDYAKNCNLNFGFNYDTNTKKFSFVFPSNPAFDYFVIIIPSELAERLGFDFTTNITKEKRTGKVTKDADDFNIDETANEARALCLDTALVLISDYYNSSNKTAGMNNSYLTALYPTTTGTSMETPMVESCHAPTTMRVSSTLATSKGFVLPKFKLSRFLDNRNFVDFVWTKGAYVSGILRGKK
jgi:hypothetical protein